MTIRRQCTLPQDAYCRHRALPPEHRRRCWDAGDERQGEGPGASEAAPAGISVFEFAARGAKPLNVVYVNRGIDLPVEQSRRARRDRPSQEQQD